LLEISEKDFDDAIAINLKGAFFGVQAVAAESSSTCPLCERAAGHSFACDLCHLERAGLSPVRSPSALAAVRIISRRPRTREAVSGLLFQIGVRTLITAAVSISAMGVWPISGKA
jgi:NAD(P)-dependent dehydrogenase (short-subunit alcohol dehydrogenase family)